MELKTVPHARFARSKEFWEAPCGSLEIGPKNPPLPKKNTEFTFYRDLVWYEGGSQILNGEWTSDVLWLHMKEY